MKNQKLTTKTIRYQVLSIFPKIFINSLIFKLIFSEAYFVNPSVFHLCNSGKPPFICCFQLCFPITTKTICNENFQSRCLLSRSEDHRGPWDLGGTTHPYLVTYMMILRENGSSRQSL